MSKLIKDLKAQQADLVKKANAELADLSHKIHDAVAASFPRGFKALVHVADGWVIATVHHVEGEFVKFWGNISFHHEKIVAAPADIVAGYDNGGDAPVYVHDEAIPAGIVALVDGVQS